jgi:hypothetical protein
VSDTKKFIVVSERGCPPHEEKLRLAVRSLNEKLSLPLSNDQITRQIMATTRQLPSLTQGNPKLLNDLLLEGLKEASAAIRTNPSTKSARHARQLAKFILSTRTNRRGAPEKYDPEIVLAFCDTIERIVGRKLTASHRKNLAPGFGQSETLSPESPMLSVLLAALDWVFTQFQPYLELSPVNAEGVLTVIRKRRSSARQI